MTLLIRSSKHLTKGADRIVLEAVPRDTREDGIYILAYIILFFIGTVQITTLLRAQNPTGPTTGV